MRKLLFIAVLMLIGLLTIERGMAVRPGSGNAQASTRGTSPITYQHIVRDNPPVHLHIITVDLRDPRVRLKLCRAGDDPDGDGPWQTTIKPVREITEENHLEAAVNGNFFRCKDVQMLGRMKIPYYSGNWAMAQGFAMSDGKAWSTTNGGGQTLIVDRAGHVKIGTWHPTIPQDAWQAVGGFDLLVLNGRIATKSKDVSPRTVVGVDRAGTKLVMMVVDGRRDGYSVGLSGIKAAEEMIDLGCDAALNLDGGGSSTMAMRDPVDGVVRVLNRPSDGHDFPISMSIERPVVSAFGVQLIEPNSDAAKSDSPKSDLPTTAPSAQ